MVILVLAALLILTVPSKSPDALARKREYDRLRKAYARATDEEYREKERERDRNRKRSRAKKKGPLPPELDDWLIFDWENGYIQKRNEIEAYRPLLKALHMSDLNQNVVRTLVYETTPLKIDIRAVMPMVWQTNRSATIRVAGAPLIKRFKVTDPKEDNPIPIGEGELARKYLVRYKGSKGSIFPPCKYPKVLDAPIYFMPTSPPDLLEFDVEYVDISRCYSQLLGRLPSLAIYFAYAAKMFSSVPSLPPYDKDLLQSKHFGRAIVGMMRRRFGRCFVYGEPKKFLSRFYHGDTANWVHGVLHCLASYAVEQCGCFRWHTDGGMFPRNGGRKFARLLDSLGLEYTLEHYQAVLFASLDQYEAVAYDGNVRQTKGFLSTYVDDFVFNRVEDGGSQRNNIINGLNSHWFYKTMGA